MTQIFETPIDVALCLSAVASPRAGGVDIFIGTVRDNADGKSVHQLEYSAYVPMARKVMEDIEAEIRSRWSVEEVVMVHRIGLLNVGDVAVLTGISAAHRREAFEACRYAIDRVKELVPIWKKEHYASSAEWVAPDSQLHRNDQERG
jgi:molybdopterin synthase catalytic subunit